MNLILLELSSLKRVGPASLVGIATMAMGWGCGGDGPSSGSLDKRDEVYSEVVNTPEFREACAEIPACAESLVPAPGPAETIWRILVKRGADGEISIERVDPVDVPEGDGVPVGPLAGDFLLVGLDPSGEPVDGQLIRFPTAARIEFQDQQEAPKEIDLGGSEVSNVGYIRALPSIQTLEVWGESRTTVASVPTPSILASLSSTTTPQMAGFAAPAWAATHPWRGLPAHCSHVMVLEGEQDRDLLGGTPIGLIIDLEGPGPRHLASTQAALQMMTPLLCKSISRIAFGPFRVDGYSGLGWQAGWGDTFLINTGYYTEESLNEHESNRIALQHTVLHEAGHQVEALLNAEGSRPEFYGGDWIPSARTLANSTIDNVRLEKGLRDEWLRVQESFKAQNWAKGYTWRGMFDDSNEWSISEVATGGFMAPYGATSWFDDIAEFISWTYMYEAYATGPQFSRERNRAYGCREMNAYTQNNLPAHFAAVYTKLLFLQDLGLIKPLDVEACTGPYIGLPQMAAGFEIWQDDTFKRRFDSGVKAGIGSKGGTRIFTMEAKGSAGFGDATYPAKMNLSLDLDSDDEPIAQVPWPRGVYELGLFGNNTLLLRLDGAPAGDFNAKDGFVVVAEASNQRIAGSIHLTVAFRPHAPLPVPQTFDPPLVVRFLMEN